MAKRAPVGEGVYNPLDARLAESVIKAIGVVQNAADIAAGGEGRAAVDQARHSPTSDDDRQDSAPPRVRHRGLEIANVPARALCREKRVLVTPEEERQIERLVDRIGETLGTSLKLSHLLRACMTVVCHAEEEILRHALTVPNSRPSNGNTVALARFELALARLLSAALRDAPMLR